MLKHELVDYLLNLGFTKEQENSYTKIYDMFTEVEEGAEQANKVKIEYKIQSKIVYVIYHIRNTKSKRYKGKLAQLRVNNEGNLVGLKTFH